MDEPRVKLIGSTKRAPSGDTLVGKTDPAAAVTVTIVLKPKTTVDDSTLHELNRTLPAKRQAVDRPTFTAQYGADSAAIAAVQAFAAKYGLSVAREDATRRVVDVTGTVAQIEQAFGTTLQDFARGSLKFRGRSGDVLLPASIAPYVEAVMGLDNRPAATPHIFRPRAAQTQYYPKDLAALYAFPKLDGSDQTVAVIELGGAYDPNDLQAYFSKALPAGTPSPTVQTVSVSPGVPVKYGGADDDEVMLDIEVIGGIAPKAKIVVYFCENSDQGFYQALSQAVHDPATSVVSISWGSPEKDYTQQTMDAWETVAKSAALLDVSIFAAAGDHGCCDEQSTDPGYDGQRHADFPGTCPHIVSCGGTHLESNNGTRTNESVWNTQDGWATGGGISDNFPVSAWQDGESAEPGKPTPMRGVPDVAGVADPTTGINVRVHGQDEVRGGTSAVAPLWSALTALLNQRVGRKVGLITPLLYANPEVLNDIVTGDNSVNSVVGFKAKPGWDACTGLGSPNGANLDALFSGTPLVGTAVAAKPATAGLAAAATGSSRNR